MEKTPELTILSVKKGADSKILWLLLLIALPGFFIALGMLSNGCERIWQFGIALLGVFLAWRVRNVFLRSDRPVATFSAEGISLPEGIVFRWDLIKEAVLFKYAGQKWVGFALHDSAIPLLSEHQKKLTDASLYGEEFHMPIAFSCDELAENPESWLPTIQDRFRIPFRRSNDPDPLMVIARRPRPGQKVAGILGVIVLWPVSALMIFGAIFNHQLDHKGLLATASIIEQPLLSKGRDGRYYYHLHYRYMVKPVQRFCDAKDTVSEAMGHPLAIGSNLQIRYLPGDACYSQVIGSTEHRPTFWSALLIIGFSLLWTKFAFRPSQQQKPASVVP